MHELALACIAERGLPWTVRHAVLARLTLYDRLVDATDTLATDTGYLELSWDGGTVYWWDHHDHAVDDGWLEDSGSRDTRPSVPAPPELRRRLQALVRRCGVPCVLHADIAHAPWSPAFQGAYELIRGVVV